jgi:hypothetical protein
VKKRSFAVSVSELGICQLKRFDEQGEFVEMGRTGFKKAGVDPILDS